MNAQMFLWHLCSMDKCCTVIGVALDNLTRLTLKVFLVVLERNIALNPSLSLSPSCILSSHKIQFSTTLPILKIWLPASQFSHTTWKSPIVFCLKYLYCVRLKATRAEGHRSTPWRKVMQLWNYAKTNQFYFTTLMEKIISSVALKWPVQWEFDLLPELVSWWPMIRPKIHHVGLLYEDTTCRFKWTDCRQCILSFWHK